MTTYKFSSEEAAKIHKHGIDLTIYNENIPQVNVVQVSVEEGHFQEFLDKECYFIYSIHEGNGLFVLNDEKVEAKAGDLVVIPPKTRIHYFGKMKMTLTVSPAFRPENEEHIRFVEKSESPFLNNDL
jgi:mannose-6-phosphate isomerase-like protein (cupin superfamily)